MVTLLVRQGTSSMTLLDFPSAFLQEADTRSLLYDAIYDDSWSSHYFWCTLEYSFQDQWWVWLNTLIQGMAWGCPFSMWDNYSHGSYFWSHHCIFIHKIIINVDVIRAFCEAWCPSTNTLYTPLGKMCISLELISI